MNKRTLLVMILSVVFTLALLLSALGLEARAQDGSGPTPTPATPAAEDAVFKYDEPAYVENGDADWRVWDSQFASNYPDGFTFTGYAESSAGEIVSVSVFFSHNPGFEDDTRQRGTVDPATGRLEVVVAGRDADGIPPWLPVNYRWRVSDSTGTVYWSEWITGAVYEDGTRDWQRFESEDIVIYTQPGFPEEAVQLSFDAMAAAHPIYIKAFGRDLSYKPIMLLFADLDTFREWRSFEAGAGGSFIVGQASPRWGAFVQVLWDDDMYELAYGTVVHEIAHLYQHDTYEFRGPGWWIEGNATLFELEQGYDYEARVRTYAELNDLPPLFVEGGPLPSSAGPDGRGRWGYDVGYTFNKWFISTYGWEAHAELIAIMGEPEEIPAYEIDERFAAALETVTGQPASELEAAWRAWLGAPAVAPTLIPTPTLAFRFPPTMTPFGE